MKLIAETTFDNISCVIEEATETSPKKVFLEGIFMQAETKNRNGRVYPRKIMEPVIEKYMNEKVKPGRAIAEMMHPTSGSINLDRVSHRVTDLFWEGNDIHGKALVLNTPCGNIVKGLLEGGVNIGVSSRGLGSLKEENGVKIVSDDYSLICIDVVNDPSAPDAWVNGILEGVEYIFDSKGRLIEQEVESLEARVEREVKQRKPLDERAQLKNLQRFLSSL